ncbi:MULTISPECIES: DMT family transporter [Microbacterium]|uniref:Permease of the drug/metabolite transporter (DMT) superfamily n=1 Tax=Microbacterium saccharophilum TaxID=1213358 RepID=A0A7Z7GF06_9MICO|nr:MULTISPECIES: DMT family transporter [Microbacterium]SFI46863.1 Permease of the drug/metabolite transporter (DMT) superfamily [Microbacterium saccharophilum]
MSEHLAAGVQQRAPNPWRMLWVTFAWGSCFTAISIGLQDAPLLWLAALRALVAGGALLVPAIIRRTPIPRDAHSWTLLVVLGVVNVAVAYAAMFGGTIGLTTGVASVLANIQPLLILLPAWWIYRERPTARAAAAMLAGLAGLLLVVLPAGVGTGAWLSLTSAAAVTTGTLISRAVRADPFVAAAAQLLLGGGILLVAAAVVEGPPIIDWTPKFVFALAWMSLAGTAATTVAWFTEAQRSRLDMLTSWTILVPVFGILLSIAFLQETQSVLGWIGMAIVVGAVAVLSLPGRHDPRRPRDGE